MSDWHAQAACRGVATETFYAHEDARNRSHRERLARTAIKICRGCPVATECLDAALTEPGPQHGIRAGTYAKTRTRMVLSGRAA